MIRYHFPSEGLRFSVIYWPVGYNKKPACFSSFSSLICYFQCPVVEVYRKSLITGLQTISVTNSHIDCKHGGWRLCDLGIIIFFMRDTRNSSEMLNERRVFMWKKKTASSIGALRCSWLDLIYIWLELLTKHMLTWTHMHTRDSLALPVQTHHSSTPP